MIEPGDRVIVMIKGADGKVKAARETPIDPMAAICGPSDPGLALWGRAALCVESLLRDPERPGGIVVGPTPKVAMEARQ